MTPPSSWATAGTSQRPFLRPSRLLLAACATRPRRLPALASPTFPPSPPPLSLLVTGMAVSEALTHSHSDGTAKAPWRPHSLGGTLVCKVFLFLFFAGIRPLALAAVLRRPCPLSGGRCVGE